MSLTNRVAAACVLVAATLLPGRSNARDSAPVALPILREASAVDRAAARTRAFADDVRALAMRSPPPGDAASRERLAGVVARLGPHLGAEVRAIASAAGIPEEAVWRATLERHLDGDGEIAAAVLGSRSVTGEIDHRAHLRTGAGIEDALRTAAWVVEAPGETPYLGIGSPLGVGCVAGVNVAGLAITASVFASDEAPAPDGLPLTVLVRDLLASALSLDAAVEHLRTAPLLTGIRVLLTDGERLEARIVERTPTLSRVRTAEDGWALLGDPEPEPSCFLGACDPAFPDPSAATMDLARGLATRLEAEGRWIHVARLATVFGAPSEGMVTVGLRPATREAFLRTPTGPERTIAWIGHLDRWRLGAYHVPPLVTGEIAAEAVGPSLALQGVRHLRLTFASARPSGFAFNDRVPLELFLPEVGDARGVLIQLPAWKERTLVGHRALAFANARKGLATAILPLPYQNGREPPGVRAGVWTLSADLARTRQAALQGLADIAAVSLVLERQFGFPPERQAIGGISLGAHMAATALGLYPHRFRTATLVLAGGRVHEAFVRPNSVTGRVQEDLLARGVTPEEAARLLAPLEPLAVADAALGKAVLLIAAEDDDVVTAERASALAKAWGNTRLVWLKGGHYAPVRPDQAVRVLEEVGAHLLRSFPER